MRNMIFIILFVGITVSACGKRSALYLPEAKTSLRAPQTIITTITR